MIHKIGICAPVEPGTLSDLRRQIAGHLNPGIEFEIYIVDRPPSVELDYSELGVAIKACPGLHIEPYAGNYVSPLDSLQRNHKRYKHKNRGKR